MAFSLLGCSDDDGTSGTGGSGGKEPGTAMVTVVHLAPEDRSAADTRVDILVNGAAAIDCAPEAGPVPVPVMADVVSILVAVDEDTTDESLEPELWAIIPDASDEPIRLVKTQ